MLTTWCTVLAGCCQYCQKPAMLFLVRDWLCKWADSGKLIHKPGKRDPHGWQEAHEVVLHKASSGQGGEKGDVLEEIKYNQGHQSIWQAFLDEVLNRCIKNYSAFPGKDSFTL